MGVDEDYIEEPFIPMATDEEKLEAFKNGASLAQVRRNGRISDDLLVGMFRHDPNVLDDVSLHSRIQNYSEVQKLDLVYRAVYEVDHGRPRRITPFSYFEEVSEAVCIEAIKICPDDWRYVPESIQDKVMQIALQENPIDTLYELPNFLHRDEPRSVHYSQKYALITDDMRHSALTHGQEKGQIRTDVLYAHKHLFSDALLDTINPKIREGLAIVEALNFETEEEKAIALKHALAEPTPVSISLEGINFDDPGEPSPLPANLSEAEMFAAVTQDPASLATFANPSEKVKAQALTAEAFEWMESERLYAEVNPAARPAVPPREEVLIKAVSMYGKDAYQYIDHPTEAINLAAVEKQASLLHAIKNPSVAVQLAALAKDGVEIEYIADPNEALQLAAVRQLGACLYYLPNPSEAVQLEAVKQNGTAIEFITNPSEQVQRTALTHDCAPGEVRVNALASDGSYVRFTPEVLDAVRPGLAAAAKSIRALEEGYEERQALLTDFMACKPVTGIELPDDLTFDMEDIRPNKPVVADTTPTIPTQSRGDRLKAKVAQSMGHNGNTQANDYGLES